MSTRRLPLAGAGDVVECDADRLPASDETYRPAAVGAHAPVMFGHGDWSGRPRSDRAERDWLATGSPQPMPYEAEAFATPASAGLDTAAIARRIAERVTIAIEQISTGIAGGASSEAMVQTIASGIAETVTAITHDVERARSGSGVFVLGISTTGGRTGAENAADAGPGHDTGQPPPGAHAGLHGRLIA